MAASPKEPKKVCRRGHKLTPKNVKLDYRGYRMCRTCMSIWDDNDARSRHKKARERKKVALTRTVTCPGCNTDFSPKNSRQHICPTCNASPLTRDVARKARNLALEQERDKEALALLEAEKRPRRYVGPITAEALIAQWGRG